VQSLLDKMAALQKLITLNQLNADPSALINALPGFTSSEALINANQRVPPASGASIDETVKYLRDLSDRV
jgi:hypothetical protein